MNTIEKRNTGANLSQLKDLAAAVKQQHATVVSLAAESDKHARAAIEAAITCGASLAEAKQSLPHGMFSIWLADSCPDLSARTARNYMALYEAAKRQHDAVLDQAGLRKAYQLAGIIPQDEPKHGEQPANSNVGGILDLDAILGLRWLQWRKKEFEPNIETAPHERLQKWAEALREPHEAYLAVMQKLGALPAR